MVRFSRLVNFLVFCYWIILVSQIVRDRIDYLINGGETEKLVKMDDNLACPRCKTTKYRNPSLKLLVNSCGHALCDNCVELLFVKGNRWQICPFKTSIHFLINDLSRNYVMHNSMKNWKWFIFVMVRLWILSRMWDSPASFRISCSVIWGPRGGKGGGYKKTCPERFYQAGERLP